MSGPFRGRKPSLLLLAFTLAACGRMSSPPSAPPAYEHVRDLLLSERLQQAAAETALGLAAAPPGSQLAWNFRLLRVEILLAQREAKKALAALNAAPPDKPAFAEQMARYRLCRAHAALLLHDNAAARKWLDEAQPLARNRLRAEVELRRAALAIASRDPAGATQLLRRVLEYANAHNDRALRMSATGSMGFLLLRSGRYDEAIPWFDQTLAQAQTLGAKTSEARVFGNLGSCYFRLGDLDKAIGNFRQAEASFAALGNRYEQQLWLGNIGNVEISRQNYSAAAVHYRHALQICQDLGDEAQAAAWLNNLATVSIQQQDWDAAERYNQAALERKQHVGDDASRSYSLVNAGLIAQARGRPAEARKTFQTVLRGPAEDLTTLLDAHAGLAGVFASQRRDTEAEAEFRSALAVIARQQAALLDEGSRLTWFASVIRFYHQYVDFLMRRGKTLAALQVVQSSRGRVLSARLNRPESRARYTPAHLQRMLGHSGTTLLVFWIAPGKSYAWVVTKNSIYNYQVPDEAELRRLVTNYDAFLQQLRDPLRESSAAGEMLFEKLIAPARLSAARVLLAPDGPLYSLNFATLPVTGVPKAHYWIEDVQLSMLPSFDLLPATQPHAHPALLLIGDPVSSDAEFPELAFAGQEISAIRKRLAGVPQVVFTRNHACPKSFLHAKPEEFSWIHFVAHATSNESEPLQSAVILSREAGSEFRLFAHDVVRIPLRADLVTLSACHSAGARIYAGEGLVGLAWAFLKSGAGNVIAGLWDVNDRSTAETMAGLYTGLAKGVPPAEALRTAQLSLLRSSGVFRKPYYWGPFEIFQAAPE